jgi:nucleoside triphosphatase
MARQAYPEPTVGVFVFRDASRFLLVKSDKWKGLYVTPGGHIEIGEKIEDAARREILEETGLRIHSLEFIHFHEFIFGEGFHKKGHFICFKFRAMTDTTDVKLNSEAQDYVWVTAREAESLPLAKNTRNSLELLKKMLSL